MQDGKKYTYTQHSDESIGQLVRTQYLANGSVLCRFYVSGLHDDYPIEHSSGRYVLRVYRADWHDKEEVQFELSYART
jgi:Ser/Thr protein kinase RdoA (MazF antagonist)